MQTLRFALDSITCRSKASPDGYADTLTIKLTLFREEVDAEGRTTSVQIDGFSSTLGMRGPRMDIFFLPNGTHHFVRTDFSPGTNMDWELLWEVADDDTAEYKVVFEAINDRDIDDPYAVARFLLDAGVVVGGVVLAKAGKEGLALLAAKFGAKLVEKGLDKLLPGLIDEWPECAGRVYARSWTYRAAEWAQRSGQRRDLTEHPEEAKEGCGTPEYELAYTIEVVPPPPVFGQIPKPRTSTWIPRAAPAGGAWAGVWSDVSGVPWVTIDIAGAGAGAFRVAANEVIGAERQSVLATHLAPIIEESLLTPVWNGPVTPRVRTGEPVAREDILAPKNGTLQQTKKNRFQTVFGGDDEPDPATGNDAPANEQGTAPDQAPPPALKAGWTARGGMVAEAKPKRALHEALKSAALRLPEQGVTLFLYDLEEVMPGGKTRVTGPFLRYIRAANGHATAADLMLFQHGRLA